MIAQEPKLFPHLQEMKVNIGAALGLDPKRIGIKATTNERLGCMRPGRNSGDGGRGRRSAGLKDAKQEICRTKREASDGQG